MVSIERGGKAKLHLFLAVSVLHVDFAVNLGKMWEVAHQPRVRWKGGIGREAEFTRDPPDAKDRPESVRRKTQLWSV